MNKILILGVGSQKSGTTWFADSLNTSKRYAPGYTKEYHAFDTGHWFLERRDHLLCQLSKKIADGSLALDGSSASVGLLRSILFSQDYSSYFDYFRSLADANPTKTMFSDITPSYSALSSSTLSFIRGEFCKRGFTVKPVFLMRDPVERAVSSAIQIINSPVFRSSFMHCKSLDEFLVGNHFKDFFAIRGDYISTVNSLDSAFAGEGVLYEFYEHLFSADFVDKFKVFSGDDSYSPDFSKRVNDSALKKKRFAGTSVSSEVRAILRDYYSDIYLFVRNRFRDIPLSWSA